MHGSVINVLTNVDQLQSIISQFTTWWCNNRCCFEWCFEYESFYMSINVRSNMVMVTLWNLIETPIYKYLNVNIHHQWASLFVLHTNLKYQILFYNNAWFDNFDSNNEEIHCTPIDSMIQKF